jgi:hypothetical protein
MVDVPLVVTGPLGGPSATWLGGNGIPSEVPRRLSPSLLDRSASGTKPFVMASRRRIRVPTCSKLPYTRCFLGCVDAQLKSWALQYPHWAWSNCLSHFCLRDLHTSQLVSVRRRLSASTRRLPLIAMDNQMSRNRPEFAMGKHLKAGLQHVVIMSCLLQSSAQRYAEVFDPDVGRRHKLCRCKPYAYATHCEQDTSTVHCINFIHSRLSLLDCL